MSIRIKLTRGMHAIIDDADFEAVSRLKWHAHPGAGSRFYARSYNGGDQIYLHRFLLKPPRELGVDHANGDGLDNRRCNLRVCTQGQNLANSTRPRVVAPYRGLSVDNRGGQPRYSAKIGTPPTVWNGPKRTSAEEAARDYDAEAVRRYGEFATLNFPWEWEKAA